MASTGVLVVTGASGAGKSTTLRELDARAVPGVRCFHFDSIGVPTLEVMEREYGGGDQWQAAATADWLAELRSLPSTVQLAVLEGQMRPSVILSVAARAAPRVVRVALFDCDSDIRSERLAGPRQQPELASTRMDRWAAYLRAQADALGLPVIDTSELSITEAADELERLVRRQIELNVLRPSPRNPAVEHHPIVRRE